MFYLSDYSLKDKYFADFSSRFNVLKNLVLKPTMIKRPFGGGKYLGNRWVKAKQIGNSTVQAKPNLERDLTVYKVLKGRALEKELSKSTPKKIVRTVKGKASNEKILDFVYKRAALKGRVAKAEQLLEAKRLRSGYGNTKKLETDGYKVRTDPPPKKTITSYKAFRMIDGELYPMFVGAKDPLPVGRWLDATEGGTKFMGDKGKLRVPALTGDYVRFKDLKEAQKMYEAGLIKSPDTKGLTSVAYRAGWHGGEKPFFPQAGKLVKYRGKKVLLDVPDNYPYPHVHRKNTVMAEVEMSADKNYQQEFLDKAVRNDKGEINYNESGLQYVPKEGYYQYATNSMVRDHPEYGKWHIGGAVKINKVLTQQEANDLMKKSKLTPQRWEDGDVLDLESLGYKQSKKITRDDKGRVIPLSKRFDRNKKDSRY